MHTSGIMQGKLTSSTLQILRRRLQKKILERRMYSEVVEQGNQMLITQTLPTMKLCLLIKNSGRKHMIVEEAIACGCHVVSLCIREILMKQ